MFPRIKLLIFFLFALLIAHSQEDKSQNQTYVIEGTKIIRSGVDITRILSIEERETIMRRARRSGNRSQRSNKKNTFKQNTVSENSIPKVENIDPEVSTEKMTVASIENSTPVIENIDPETSPKIMSFASIENSTPKLKEIEPKVSTEKINITSKEKTAPSLENIESKANTKKMSIADKYDRANKELKDAYSSYGFLKRQGGISRADEDKRLDEIEKLKAKIAKIEAKLD